MASLKVIRIGYMQWYFHLIVNSLRLHVIVLQLSSGIHLQEPHVAALRDILLQSGIAFSPDGQLLAAASWDNTIRLWDPFTGDSRSTTEGLSVKVDGITFAPDGQHLALISRDCTVRLWDPSTGASCKTLEGHSDAVCAVAYSQDGQLLASASSDHTVRVWDPSTGASRILGGHSDAVCAVAFSPDGQVLASASRDNTIRLWDPIPGASHRTLEGHFDAVLAVAFSPDGQTLASGSADHTVRLWNPSTGALRGTLEGHHRNRVFILSFEVAFSPDGRLLAISSEGPIYLWDIRRREIIRTLLTEGSIRYLSFTSNSSYLETNHGIVEITSLTQVESRSQSNSIVCPLRVSGNWVKWGTENILWLPPDYRPIRGCGTAVRYNVLAITYEPGRVIFIEIDPETIPLGESFGYDGQQIV